MKKFRLVLILVALVQLTACANKIDLFPRYDQNTKTLQVDTLVFSPIQDFAQRKENSFGAGTQLTKSFSMDDESCEGVVVQLLNPHANAYFYNSAKQRIMDHYGDSCLSRNIGNVYSLRCMRQMGDQVGFYLTASVRQHEGYGKQFTYVLPSNNCLKKFEESFIGRVQAEAVGAFNSNKLGYKENYVRSLVAD